MNIKLALLLLSVSFVTIHAGIQTGDLNFNNTLAQTVNYEYATKPSGTIPGINAPKGINVKGQGNIPANTNQVIRSSLKVKNENAWGDIIDVVLRRNSNESYPFKINQLGTYTIAVDPNNNLTLKK